MVIKAHCYNCDNETNHQILYTTTTSWDNEEAGIGGKDDYYVLQCNGCDRVILKQVSHFSEEPEPIVFYYPPSSYKKQPRWIHDISGRNAMILRHLLSEIYIGMQNDTKMLVSMGVRSLVEYVMIDTVGDQGSFKNNLKIFSEQGYISSKQRQILNLVLEAGHATIHRAYQPTYEDLCTCIDISESVLLTVYVHPEKADKLSLNIAKKSKYS